jgi:paraquat-inducible protein B
VTDAPGDPPTHETLPAARIRRRRRWVVYLVWLVPLIAAVVAGYFTYSRMQEFGPTITITFRDGTGLKPGQSEIRYRGVTVGDVSTVHLSHDLDDVVVSARVRREAAAIAREGSVFWVVRPEVGIETVRGLTTVITGPYIEVMPGSGGPKTEFAGVDRPSPALGRRGLQVTLAAAQLSATRPRAVVYYRGIEVGLVTATALSRDATTAHVRLLIEPRYARLVRIGSRFWTASGVEVNLSLFKGLEINVDSLRSLIAGGIVFATPSSDGPPAKEDTVFVLHDKPEKEWLGWAPKIPISAGDGADSAPRRESEPRQPLPDAGKLRPRDGGTAPEAGGDRTPR